jgi:hypothetical protein
LGGRAVIAITNWSAEHFACACRVCIFDLNLNAGCAAREKRHGACRVFVENERSDAFVLESLFGELGFREIGKRCDGYKVHDNDLSTAGTLLVRFGQLSDNLLGDFPELLCRLCVVCVAARFGNIAVSKVLA